eukprot:6193754-Pleurochrysis_carterae.AAC.2
MLESQPVLHVELIYWSPSIVLYPFKKREDRKLPLGRAGNAQGWMCHSMRSSTIFNENYLTHRQPARPVPQRGVKYDGGDELKIFSVSVAITQASKLSAVTRVDKADSVKKKHCADGVGPKSQGGFSAEGIGTICLKPTQSSTVSEADASTAASDGWPETNDLPEAAVLSREDGTVPSVYVISFRPFNCDPTVRPTAILDSVVCTVSCSLTGSQFQDNGPFSTNTAAFNSGGWRCKIVASCRLELGCVPGTAQGTRAWRRL